MDHGAGGGCLPFVSDSVDVRQFMGMRSEKSVPERCRFFVLPVPYERTTSYRRGTARGPMALIRASGQVEAWDEEVKKETWKLGICTLPPFGSNARSNVFFPKLESKVCELLGRKETIPFFLGGEHTITQALIPPFLEKYPGLSVLHFDAHADLRKTYEGTVHNHACSLYPVSRKCRVVQVGIRNVGPEELHNVNSGNVKTFLMHENLNIGMLVKNVLKHLSNTVYMTIDLDGFDPSVIPGTGTPQPGGFLWYDALKLFSEVCRKKKVVGVDVVELAPQRGSVISEFTAAKLVYRLMGYLSR